MISLHDSQIGGATGLVGDPSGRNTERPLSEASVVENNVDHLVASLNRFFKGAIEYAKPRVDSLKEDLGPPKVLNNLEWFKDMGLLQFLRTVGINARVNTMLARERCVAACYHASNLSPHLLACNPALNPNKASRSPNSRTSSCKHMIS